MAMRFGAEYVRPVAAVYIQTLLSIKLGNNV